MTKLMITSRNQDETIIQRGGYVSSFSSKIRQAWQM